ncbi:glycoside hydrolase family 97 protein [Flavobacterium psychrotrophum]|uniref:glycoside hydrolase family 97 protein n=1 Tax=Flavobacterium psychrotrophum TaxID=2294119 RepID=UPI000E318711|nr:glycoside hydrolase family 97 protein [Flavobacterium psychrotrophum]
MIQKLSLASLALILASCASGVKTSGTEASPDGKLTVDFGVNKKEQAYYLVKNNKTVVIDTSYIGLVRKDANFFEHLHVASIGDSEKVTDSYTMLQGKKKDITYTANQKVLHLENKDGQKMDVIFNVSEHGLAFKYKFPETSEDVKYITEEKTSFNFVAGSKAWLQPMSEVKSGWEHSNPAYEEYYQLYVPVGTPSTIGQGWVFPALFKAGDTWVSVSETGLGSNYCASHLDYDKDAKTIKIVFPQDKERFAADAALNPESKTPWETPWRILAIGSLNDVTDSTLGTDLADKTVEGNTAFVKPGISSWSWAILKDDSVNYDTTKQFIDYAHDMNWPYCLIDADWHKRIGMDKIKELLAYAKERNVKLILWYNSAGDWNTVPYGPKDKFLTAEGREKEFKMLEDLGVGGVKIDFFGGDGQSMIAYYHDILKSALKHKILVNFHGATLPRGWQRTYPNLMTAEAIKGFEYITFEQQNADHEPSHAAIIPFTRNLYDPMDFTPMALDKIPNINRRTTSGFELALPTLFMSGIQHLAEIPEGMAKMPDYVVTYLKDIPTAWDESKLVAGYPGKDVVIARRKGDAWFITGINGEDKAKDISIDLSFLKKDGYMITDGAASLFDKTVVKPGKTTVKLKPNGGFIMKF